MDNSNWIDEAAPLSTEQLKALGAITLYWNLLEGALFWLFCTTSNIGGDAARLLTHDMQTPTLCEKIKTFTERYDLMDAEVKDLVFFGLRSADICRINRNQFTHFVLQSKKEGGLGIFRNKGATFEFPMIDHDYATMSKVAKDIHKTSNFIVNLSNYIAENRTSGFLGMKPTRSPYGDTLSPPEKFPLPKKVWSPPNPQQTPNRK